MRAEVELWREVKVLIRTGFCIKISPGYLLYGKLPMCVHLCIMIPRQTNVCFINEAKYALFRALLVGLFHASKNSGHVGPCQAFISTAKRIACVLKCLCHLLLVAYVSSRGR